MFWRVAFLFLDILVKTWRFPFLQIQISLTASAFEERLEEKKNQCRRSRSHLHLSRGSPPSCPLLLQGIALATHEETSGALQDSDIRVNTNLEGGCDKQYEPEPKSFQIEQHETR